MNNNDEPNSPDGEERRDGGVRSPPRLTLLDKGAAHTQRDGGPAPTHIDDGSVHALGFRDLPPELDQDYEVVREFPATGSEADIFLVRTRATGEQVIIKLYRLGIAPKPEVLKRITQISHARLIRLYAYGQAGGRWYEILEYASYGSLRERLSAGPLATALVWQLLADLDEALAQLHEQDLCHRDLKPDNILLRSLQPLDLALTDFGITSVIEASQHFSKVSRTVKYAAPELLSGVLTNYNASDYWALGLIVLESLTGRQPFDGLSEQIVNYRLATLSIDLSALQEPWRALCEGLLERDPKQRWGHREVVAWLKRNPMGGNSYGNASLAEEGKRAKRPYKIGQASCWTRTELAAGLAGQWALGVRDMERGEIEKWLKSDLHDANLAEFVTVLTQQSRVTADVQLLRLILRLDPDTPPVWWGYSLGFPELQSYATKAMQGDARLAELLQEIFQKKVLLEFAQLEDRNSGVTYTVTHRTWVGEVESYNDAWSKALNAGAPRHLRQDMLNVLPVLLLTALSPKSVVKFREKLRSQLLDDARHCPWFLMKASVDETSTGETLVLLAIVDQANVFGKHHKRELDRSNQASQKSSSTRSAPASLSSAGVQDYVHSGTGVALDHASPSLSGAGVQGSVEPVQPTGISGQKDKSTLRIVVNLGLFAAIWVPVYFFAVNKMNKGSEKQQGAAQPSVSTASVKSPLTEMSSPSTKAHPEIARALLSQIQNANSITLNGTAVVSNYAIQDWRDENTGGEALLQYDSSKGWVLKSMGGGAWDVPGIVSFGVPLSIAEKLIPAIRATWTSKSASAGMPQILNEPTRIEPATLASIAASEQGARLEPPQLQVGDTYVFESRNITEPNLNYTAERKVIGIDGDTVKTTMRILKNGYTWHVNYDHQWNVISSRSQAGDGSDHSPAVRYFDFPLYPGKTWTASSEERNVKTGKTRVHKMRGNIGEWEEVTVPAGHFRGIKVTLNTEFEDESGLVSAEDVSWYVPEVKRTVLSKITSLNHKTKERREQEIALLSFQMGAN